MSSHPLALSIPPVSEEVFRDLEHSFPRSEVVPNLTTMDELMFNAGQRQVIDWLKAKYTQRSIVTGSL